MDTQTIPLHTALEVLIGAGQHEAAAALALKHAKAADAPAAPAVPTGAAPAVVAGAEMSLAEAKAQPREFWTALRTHNPAEFERLCRSFGPQAA